MASRWTSDSALSVKVARGTGTSHPVIVSIAKVVGSVGADVAWSENDAVKIWSMRNRELYLGFSQEEGNAGRTGGESVTVRGASIGGWDTTVRTRVGGTASVGTKWVADTATVCIVPSGVGILLEVVLTASLSVSTLSRAFSYNAPQLSAVARSNGPPSGFASPMSAGGPLQAGEDRMRRRKVTIFGSDFMSIDLSPRASIGGTQCLETRWLADSSVTCGLPRGYSVTSDDGKDLGLTFPAQIGQNHSQTAVLVAAFTFDGPSITGVEPGSTSSAGNANANSTITILGDAFGEDWDIGNYAQTLDGPWGLEDEDREALVWARVGATSCVSSTWVSESAVLCVTGPGIGVVELALRIANRSAVLRSGAKYAAPQIACVGYKLPEDASDGETPPVNGSEANRTGSLHARSNWTRGNWTYNATNSSGNVSSVGSELSEHNATGDLSLVASNMSEAVYVGWCGNASEQGGAGIAVNIGQSGGRVLTMTGSELGPWDSSVGGRIGKTAAESVQWISASSLTLKAPAATPERGVDLVISVGRQTGAVTEGVRIDAGRMLDIFPSNIGVGHGTNVTMIAENLGLFDAGQRIEARVGGSACVATVWMSDRAVFCSTAPGGHTGLGRAGVAAVLTVEGYVSSVVGGWSFDALHVDRVDPSTGLVGGGKRVEVFGQNFGVFDQSLVANIAGKPCGSLQWTSDSAVSCLTPAVDIKAPSLTTVQISQPNTVPNGSDVPLIPMPWATLNYSFLFLALTSSSSTGVAPTTSTPAPNTTIEPEVIASSALFSTVISTPPHAALDVNYTEEILVACESPADNSSTNSTSETACAARLSDGQGVDIPSRAWPPGSDRTVSVRMLSARRTLQLSTPSSLRGARLAGNVLEFGPSGTRFLRAVTLRMRFDAALLNTTPATHQVAVARFSQQLLVWETLPGSSGSSEAGFVIAPSLSFSLYAPLLVPAVSVATSPLATSNVAPIVATTTPPPADPENIEDSENDDASTLTSILAIVVPITVVFCCGCCILAYYARQKGGGFITSKKVKRNKHPIASGSESPIQEATKRERAIVIENFTGNSPSKRASVASAASADGFQSRMAITPGAPDWRRVVPQVSFHESPKVPEESGRVLPQLTIPPLPDASRHWSKLEEREPDDDEQDQDNTSIFIKAKVRPEVETLVEEAKAASVLTPHRFPSPSPAGLVLKPSRYRAPSSDESDEQEQDASLSERDLNQPMLHVDNEQFATPFGTSASRLHLLHANSTPQRSASGASPPTEELSTLSAELRRHQSLLRAAATTFRHQVRANSQNCTRMCTVSGFCFLRDDTCCKSVHW